MPPDALGLRVVERQMDIYLETCDTSCWEGSNSPLGRFKTRVLVPSAVYLLLLHEKNRCCKQGTSQKKRFPVHVRTLKQRIFFFVFFGKFSLWKNFPKSSGFADQKNLSACGQKAKLCWLKTPTCVWTRPQFCVTVTLQDADSPLVNR